MGNPSSARRPGSRHLWGFQLWSSRLWSWPGEGERKKNHLFDPIGINLNFSLKYSPLDTRSHAAALCGSALQWAAAIGDVHEVSCVQKLNENKEGEAILCLHLTHTSELTQTAGSNSCSDFQSPKRQWEIWPTTVLQPDELPIKTAPLQAGFLSKAYKHLHTHPLYF